MGKPLSTCLNQSDSGRWTKRALEEIEYLTKIKRIRTTAKRNTFKTPKEWPLSGIFQNAHSHSGYPNFLAAAIYIADTAISWALEMVNVLKCCLHCSLLFLFFVLVQVFCRCPFFLSKRAMKGVRKGHLEKMLQILLESHVWGDDHPFANQIPILTYSQIPILNSSHTGLSSNNAP